MERDDKGQRAVELLSLWTAAEDHLNARIAEVEVLKWVLGRISIQADLVEERLKTDPSVDGFSVLKGVVNDVADRIEELVLGEGPRAASADVPNVVKP